MKHTSVLTKMSFLGAILLLGFVSFNAHAERSAIHGDWKLSCDKECSVSQGLKATSSNILYGVKVNRVGNAIMAQVNLPLGIYLPQGLGVQIGTKRESVPITTCLPKGCIALFKLDRELLESMYDQSELSIRFFLSEQKPKEITFSLRGFYDAYKDMSKGVEG